jgi:hypothetical protein
MTADPFVVDQQRAALELLDRVALDDALLNALGNRRDIEATGGAPGLVGLLCAWRDDVDSEPLREIVAAACLGEHPAGALLAAGEGEHRR